MNTYNQTRAPVDITDENQPTFPNGISAGLNYKYLSSNSKSMKSTKPRVALGDITAHYSNKAHQSKVNYRFSKPSYPQSKPNEYNHNNTEIYNNFSNVNTNDVDDPMEEDNLDVNYNDDDNIIPCLPEITDMSRATVDHAYDMYFSTTYEEDDFDVRDPVMVTELSNDIFNYLRKLELKYKPNPQYMKFQTDLNWKYRSTLMNWLVETHQSLRLLPETLFLAVNLIDRFLSKKLITLNRYRLVAATALFIAAKYEEINLPTMEEIEYALDNQYNIDEIITAEKFMLVTLNYELGWPGPLSFLRKVSKADDYDFEIRTLAKWFLECTIMEPRLVSAPPSWLAAGAYYLSKSILGFENWSLKHVFYSGYSEEQLSGLSKLILDNCYSNKILHGAIWKKYSSNEYNNCTQIFENWNMLQQ